MKNGLTSKYFDSCLYYFCIIFFVSIICSFRAVSTIAIILIVATSFVKNKIDTGSLFNKKLKNIFLAGCCIFYLIQVCSFFYTNNPAETLKHLQIKSSLVLIPVAFCSSDWLNPSIRQRLISFVPVIVCLNIPADHILLAFKHDRSYVRIITLGTILNLVVNISLVNVWGATGTALSIIITELFITISLNFVLYKQGLASFISNNQTQKVIV